MNAILDAVATGALWDQAASPAQPSADDRLEKQRWKRVLEADRTRLLMTQPFTASLALQLELVPVLDSRLATAATDGRSLFANIRFLAALDDATRLFVLAHEVWHCVAGHFVRRVGRDPERWNLAADHEVNALLQHDGLPLPRDAVYFKSMDGKSAETVYTWLAGRGVRQGQVQFDDHAPSAAGIGKGGAGQALVFDPDFLPQAGTSELARVWIERAVGAAQQVRSWGRLPGGIQTWLQSRVAPQLPWTVLMRRFVQRTCGGSRRWSPPSRRHLYRQLWLPGMRADTLRVVVAIDTSGSTSDYWSQFMAEVEAMMGDFDRVDLTLVECDTTISRVRQLQREDVGRVMREGILGGGGTDLRPPFELAARNPPSCLVYLTDGYGPLPAVAPGFPVLWVLTADAGEPPSWGEAVRVKSSRRLDDWAA